MSLAHLYANDRERLTGVLERRERESKPRYFRHLTATESFCIGLVLGIILRDIVLWLMTR